MKNINDIIYKYLDKDKNIVETNDVTKWANNWNAYYRLFKFEIPDCFVSSIFLSDISNDKDYETYDGTNILKFKTKEEQFYHHHILIKENLNFNKLNFKNSVINNTGNYQYDISKITIVFIDKLFYPIFKRFDSAKNINA